MTIYQKSIAMTIIIITMFILFFWGIIRTTKSENATQETNFIECMERLNDSQWCYNKFILGE